MGAAGWVVVVSVAGLGVIGLLRMLRHLPDKPYVYEPEFLPIDEFFGELLEDADVQEMQAKRQSGEHRSFLEQQKEGGG